MASRPALHADAIVDRLFVVLAVGVGVALAGLGFGLTFIVDEWAFVASAERPALEGLIRPHNGHWMLLPKLWYGALLGTIGLRSYVPYHLAVVLTLVLAAGALYVLVGRRAGAIGGLAMGSVFLLFGSGYENYWWGFQVGFVGSVAAGLWGLVLLDGEVNDRRRAGAAVLFLVGIISSAPAAFLLGGAVLAALLRRDRRTLAALGLPLAVAIVWLLMTWSGDPGDVDVDLAALARVPLFVLEGLGHTAATIIALANQPIAYLALAALALLGVSAARRGWRPSPTFIGLLAADIALFASAALFRGQFGAGEPRYLYAAAPAVAVILAETIPVLVRPLAEAPARMRLVAFGVLSFAFLLALAGNVWLLILARERSLQSAREMRAGLDVLTGPDAVRCDLDVQVTRREQVVIGTLPGPADAARLLARFGDPREDVLVPRAVVASTDADRAFARSLLCRS